jgi:MFS superfamily sulfate permease-like transporter
MKAKYPDARTHVRRGAAAPPLNGNGNGDGSSGTFLNDLLASIVVFLVALPLCMGVAIASGMPPATGLITGIIGGIVVGTIAGSPLQVSGPAAGLTVIILEIVNEQGIAMVGPIVLAAGVIQMGAGIAKFGQWFRAVSPAVIHGMLAGIGVLIFASQFHLMVDDSPRGSGWENLLSIPESVYKGLIPQDGAEHHRAALIGVVTIAILVAWTTIIPKKVRIIPGPLVAIAVGTLVAWMNGWQIQRVAVPARLDEAIMWPTWETLGKMLHHQGFVAAVTVALVASAESLLCASAVDQMHRGPRTKYDKELFAQGVGNTLCGVVGALPMTGVIVRSSVNVTAGAKTRLSAILHGCWLLLCVLFLTQLLNEIPKSALAALLVYTGFKLVNPAHVRELLHAGRGEAVIYFVTLVAIVATDLLTGVLIGVGLSAARLLHRLSRFEAEKTASADGKVLNVHLRGCCNFLNLPKVAELLETIPPDVDVHLHVDELDTIDHACLNLIDQWEQQREGQGGMLHIDWGAIDSRFRGAEPVTVVKAGA